MVVKFVNGGLRKGKSLRLCREAFNSDKTIYTNMNFFFSRQKMLDVHLYKMSDLSNLHPNSLYILDEIHTLFPPRNNSSLRNRLLDTFVTQTAKIGIDLIFCSQLFINLPVNTRKLTNFKIDAFKNENKHRFEYNEFEMYDEVAQNCTKTYLSFEDAEKYYKMFDTHQIYTNANETKLMCLTNQELKEYAIKYVDIINDKIKSKKKNYQINEMKSILILLNLDFTTELVSLICTLLKYGKFLRTIVEC
jgi:hypothetical protein